MKQESPTGSAGDFFVYYFIRDFYLQVTNNLIDVLFRDILQFLLIINGKEVDTGVRALDDNVQCDYSESPSSVMPLL